MMLAPSMKDLLTHIDNRYMLVNIAAKRARDIAINAEEREISLVEKPVTLALNDIIDGKVEVIPADVAAAAAAKEADAEEGTEAEIASNAAEEDTSADESTL